MAVEVFMPKMSDHMEYGEIVGWLVEEGEQVDQGQVILEVMTDKAVAELEAPAHGTLKGIRAGCEPGASVPVGETMAFIAEPAEEVPILSPLGPIGPVGALSARQLVQPSDSTASGAVQSVTNHEGSVRATPVARRLAKELGVDLSRVKGSGPGGRIREAEVQAWAKRHVVAPDDVDWVDLTSIQRLTGQRMLESIRSAPQFSLCVEVDATELLRRRDALLDQVVAEPNERLSITAMLVKTVAEVLKAHPRVNASFQDGRVQLHRQINIGVAVGGGDGLVVPVVRQADEKALEDINSELKALRRKAAQMRLSPLELSGGTFTISNLGMYGIDRFDAILNPPESAILAVGRIVRRPVGMPDDTVALRPMMSLTLTIDHRVLDGLQASRFLTELGERIEEPSAPNLKGDA